MNNKPLLISGIHRSGSTWLANMLTLNSDTLFIDEPFNIGNWAFKLGGLAKGYYTYIPDIDENEARVQFQKVLENQTRCVFSKRKKEHWLPFMRTGRQIIKDPIAALSTEWLYKNFELDILILVRHPAAYVSSLKRMNWNFPFEHLSSQKKLMSSELFPFRDSIQSPPEDFIERAALSWKCIYHVLSNYINRNEWLYKRHEDLAGNPVVQIKSIYDEYDLNWNKNVEDTIKKYSDHSNPVKVKKGKTHELRRDSRNLRYKWKKDLHNNDIEIIKDITSPVWEEFYTENDW
ncbi:sulfotransferase domain-containing protein [soil metagenome]